MADFDQAALELALKRCETEPIHQLGQIQPHGALLVLSADSPCKVLQGSDNLERFFSLGLDQCLGQPLATLIGEKAFTQVKRLMLESSDGRAATGTVNRILEHTSQNFQARVFPAGATFVMEIMGEEGELQGRQLADQLLATQQALADSGDETDIIRYFGRIAVITRQLIGFDRVMVYRFDTNWDGEVIAESRKESTLSYLGNRFPASDIPLQARRLYTCNLVRQVADVDAQSVCVRPATNPRTGQPLDLTYSSLRSFSPVHIEYLRNMGVRSSMSISLLKNGELWGLIACHHMESMHLSVALQEAGAFVGRMATSKCASIEALDKRRLDSESSRIVGQLLKYITTDAEDAILRRLLPSLQALVDSTGIIVVIEGKQYVAGKVPDLGCTNALFEWLCSQSAGESFCCDNLAERFAPAASYADIAAGLLASPISPTMRNCILWLREENLRTVHWAGNPEKSVEPGTDGELRISPRKSFNAWTESWRGRCAPWSAIETTTAAQLAHAITAGLAQKRVVTQFHA